MTTHIVHGCMHGRETRMPRTWADGSLRSVNNAFTGAYFVPGVPGSYTAPSKPGVKPALVLNTAGKPQATLARATANGISVDPTKTLEQLTAQAIRGSQINRPAKGSKKVAV